MKLLGYINKILVQIKIIIKKRNIYQANQLKIFLILKIKLNWRKYYKRKPKLIKFYKILYI